MGKVIKRIFLVALILSLSITATACWSKNEPKELAAILSIVYDRDENDRYPLIIELLDTESEGSLDVSRTTSTKLIKFTGDTIAEGLRDTAITIDKKMYGAHNKVRIFTERFAQTSMKDAADFFLRDNIGDERPIMLIFKGDDPLILYEADKGLSSTLGTYVDNLYQVSKKYAEYSVFANTLQFMKDYYSEGKQPALGVVEAVLDETYISPEDKGQSDGDPTPKYVLVFNGLAVFKGDKLVGYLDKEDTRAYNAIVGNIRTTFISVDTGDGKIAGNCLKTNTKVKTRLVNDTVHVDIQVRKKIMITQNNSQYDVSNPQHIEKVEQIINDFVEQDMLGSVSTVQTEFKSDIFGFGQYFYRQHPKIWRQIKDKWDDEYFANAKINVNVESLIKFNGEIKEKFGEEAKNR